MTWNVVEKVYSRAAVLQVDMSTANCHVNFSVFNLKTIDARLSICKAMSYDFTKALPWLQNALGNAEIYKLLMMLYHNDYGRLSLNVGRILPGRPLSMVRWVLISSALKASSREVP